MACNKNSRRNSAQDNSKSDSYKPAEGREIQGIGFICAAYPVSFIHGCLDVPLDSPPLFSEFPELRGNDLLSDDMIRPGNYYEKRFR